MFSFFLVLALSGSLFVSPEEPLATPYPVEDVLPSYVETVSSGDSFSSDMAALSEQITQLQSDVAALSDSQTRAASQWAAQAYLSSSIVEVMQRVLQGSPFCDYVAFRDSTDDSSSGVLIYGLSASVSGNLITFPEAKMIHFYRVYNGSGYNNYSYNYVVQEVTDFDVAFNSYTLLYTNLLDGYPTLIPDYWQYLLYIFVAAAVLFVILMRRKKA